MIRRHWVLQTLGFFLLASIAGVLLRGMTLGVDVGLVYTNLLHAHSHIALLGWSHAALMLLLIHYFELKGSKYTWYFLISQILVLLMLPAFAAQGYALFSILFSSLHIIVGYGFTVSAWRALTGINHIPRLAIHMAKAGLLSLVMSSFGPWGLAVISSTGGKGTDLYQMAIYFYLHFQYNGWFTLGLLAVMIVQLSKWGMNVQEGWIPRACWWYVASLAPAYLLSILWAGVGGSIEAIAAAAAVVQLVAVFLILLEAYKGRALYKEALPRGSSSLFCLAGVALGAKALMEIGLVIPGIDEFAYGSRNIIIGYLHLVLLGFVSLMLVGLFTTAGWMNTKSQTYVYGKRVFITGLVINEALLFIGGLGEYTGRYSIPYMYEALLVGGVTMLGGVIFWCFSVHKKSVDSIK